MIKMTKELKPLKRLRYRNKPALHTRYESVYGDSDGACLPHGYANADCSSGINPPPPPSS